MINRFTYSKFLLVLALVVILAHPILAQASDVFAKAIANSSTSPSYVLITVINDKTGSRQTLCTVAPFLLGAIGDQYHIPFTDGGMRKIKAIALASKDRTYHFSQERALNNLRPNYTPQVLAQVRSRLKSVSTPDLIKGLQGSMRNHVYTRSKFWWCNRDALAYVLLERGLQPVQDDITGSLCLSQ